MSASTLNRWWPFDTLAFALAESRLTEKQSIARIRLLNYAWQNKCLVPLDAAVTSRIAKVKPDLWRPIMDEFTHTPDGWLHEGLSEALENAEAVVRQRREAGLASARKRANPSTAVATAVQRAFNYNITEEEGKKPIRGKLSQETSQVIPIGEARK